MQKVKITESQLKSIVKKIIKEEMSQLKEMGRDDVVLQAILNKYDQSDDATKKSIANMVVGKVDYKNFNPKNTRVNVYKALRNMDYQEASSIRKRLGIR